MKPRVKEPFGQGMVLQRNLPLKIYGEADPGERVTVSIQGKSAETVSSLDGTWECTLEPLYASVSETLTVHTEKETSVYQDVLVGEVWLAGGQSNMEFYMRYDADFDAIVRLCEDPLFRFYDVPKVSVPEHLEMRDYSSFGYWRKADPENLQYFSAVAYYFGAFLREHLQVPVGVIGCNWGGTRSACWMSRETLEKCGREWIVDYEEGLKRIPDLEKARKDYMNNSDLDTSCPFEHPFTDKMLYGMPLDELIRGFARMNEKTNAFAIGSWSEWRPNGLYEMMLKKVIPYAIAGVIWYQGESDVDHADIYADMMCGLIKEWRREWGYEFPFIMTQLAPLGDTENEMILASCSRFPEIRRQQEEVTRRLKKVYLASTSDAGHTYDIHPKNKRPVGKRLALLSLANVYGYPVSGDAPVPSEVVREGNALRIRFKNTQGRLSEN